MRRSTYYTRKTARTRNSPWMWKQTWNSPHPLPRLLSLRSLASTHVAINVTLFVAINITLFVTINITLLHQERQDKRERVRLLKDRKVYKV